MNKEVRVNKRRVGQRWVNKASQDTQGPRTFKIKQKETSNQNTGSKYRKHNNRDTNSQNHDRNVQCPKFSVSEETSD